MRCWRAGEGDIWDRVECVLVRRPLRRLLGVERQELSGPPSADAKQDHRRSGSAGTK